MRDAPLLNLVLAVALALLVGWLMVIGKPILLPVAMAVIAVYVLTSAAAGLGRLPVARLLPGVVRHGLVLLAFTLAFVALAMVITVTVNQLVQAAPRYQANLELLSAQVADMIGMDQHPTWDDIMEATVGRMSLQTVLLRLLGGLTSLGLTVFLVILYAGFLIGERARFPAKLAAAFPQAGHAEMTGRIIRDINRRIGDYLAVKTLMNVVLGTLSYAILWFMDVDFALFWAVMIGLFNYIPYVGSFVGVAFPVILSLAQFGSLGTTLAIGVLLSGAQVYVGNILEPRTLGRQLNLSPFVIIVALSVWSALWGLPGAILAVPLTSVLVIVCASFPATHFIAVLLSGAPKEVDPPIATPPMG